MSRAADSTAPTYAYQCWGRAGQLLYVGITNDLPRRMQQHALDKFWWSEVAEVTSRGFSREIEARWAEWALITTRRPPYNSSSAPPKTPDAVTDSPIGCEVVRETFPQYAMRCAQVVRRWWRRQTVPAWYAFGYGVNLTAFALATWVHFTDGTLG